MNSRKPRSNRKPLKILYRKGNCSFCISKTEPDYKEAEKLKKFVTDRGKIVGRGRSGLCQKHQRRMAREVKRARHLALIAFTVQPLF